VFWWFIKMGTAFASFVMGALLLYTSFDERQSVLIDGVAGKVAVVKAEADAWAAGESDFAKRTDKLASQIEELAKNSGKLRLHLERRIEEQPSQVEHTRSLLDHLDALDQLAGESRVAGSDREATKLVQTSGGMLRQTVFLRRQSPSTLFRLRLVEIGLPLALSVVSILLTLRYPLTEARCYEIKELLKKRREELAAAT
jgi:Na+/melibiose symporter-like transporter